MLFVCFAERETRYQLITNGAGSGVMRCEKNEGENARRTQMYDERCRTKFDEADRAPGTA